MVALLEQLVIWTLAVGASARLTRLLAVDELPLVAKPRDKIIQRFGAEHWLSYLVACPWCLGVWITLPITLSAWAWGEHTWWKLTAAWLTVAMFSSALVVKTD